MISFVLEVSRGRRAMMSPELTMSPSLTMTMAPTGRLKMASEVPLRRFRISPVAGSTMEMAGR